MKRPASQYYWGDWRRDTALQSCSLTARGLWHEMNCLMHDCEPYGHLMVGNAPMRVEQLARLVGISAKECTDLLAELEAAGVFSRTDDGAIFSRRMVRDEQLRERRAAGGHAGAEHGHKGAEAGSKGGRPKTAEGAGKGGFKTPLKPDKEPPPAFASASASAIPNTSDLSVAPARPPAEPPQLSLVDPPQRPPKGPPDCPHADILALWAEVLPAMPQHDPARWRGARADNLRTRWRETAAEKRWATADAGLRYFRKLFAYVGQSAFLTGRSPVPAGKRPFVIELEWLVNRANWDKVHEGKYHPEAAA